MQNHVIGIDVSKKTLDVCAIYDDKTRKKSFANKIQNLPCTSVIRNIEAEEEYKKLYSEMKELMEQEKIRRQRAGRQDLRSGGHGPHRPGSGLARPGSGHEGPGL